MEELKKIDFSGLKTVGITSGASTPESFFNEAIDYLKGIDE
jgi:4-hydroxy-3-methylbut-2-enyl diphosphate reductase IspH